MKTLEIEKTEILFLTYKIELSENLKGMPVARLSKLLSAGKNKGHYKSIEGYYFATEEKRQNWINEKQKMLNDYVIKCIELKTKKAAAVSSHDFKTGDLLYSSWGYDQTNIDFFEVVEVLPKSVKFRPISENIVPGSDTGFMCENVTPAPGKFIGPVCTRPVKVCLFDGQTSFRVSNGRYSLSKYTAGAKGLYQSHYA